MDEIPLGCLPVPWGNPTPVLLVLGVVGRPYDFAMVGRWPPYLRSADHDIPHRSRGVGQVRVLDGNCLDDVATGSWWNNGGRSTLLLFHQQPGAVQKLIHWMERWSEGLGREVPESFKRICAQAREAARQDLL